MARRRSRREGFILHPVPFVRGRIDPVGNLVTVRELRRVQREVAPDITHRVALQATVLGAIAAIGLPWRISECDHRPRPHVHI